MGILRLPCKWSTFLNVPKKMYDFAYVYITKLTIAVTRWWQFTIRRDWHISQSWSESCLLVFLHRCTNFTFRSSAVPEHAVLRDKFIKLTPYKLSLLIIAFRSTHVTVTITWRFSVIRYIKVNHQILLEHACSSIYLLMTKLLALGQAITVTITWRGSEIRNTT